MKQYSIFSNSLKKSKHVHTNYPKRKSSIWNINYYWSIRWWTTLLLSLSAILFGLIWGYTSTFVIDVLSILTGLVLLCIVIFGWHWNRTLDKNVIVKKRKNNHFYGLLYSLVYYTPSVVSLTILLTYILSWLISCDWFLEGYYVITPVTFLWGIVFAVDLGFILYRWTYRVMPNILLSIAAFIFYILLMTLVHGENLYLRLGILDKEYISIFLTENFTKWLGWSIIGVFISTIVSKASEDIWHGFSRSGTGDYAKIDYRFKQQRRKLLSYVGGSERSIKSLSKMGWAMILFLSVILIEGGALFFLKRGDVRHVLGMFFFIGAACTAMGFMLHVFITDENLMRAENSYLVDRKIQAIECLKQGLTPCEQLGWEWNCYCQVFVNMFCSRNPIFFENDVLHETGPVITYFLELSDDRVCLARVLADLVNCHKEQFPLYCGTEAGPEKEYLEAQFAHIAASYVDFFGAESQGEPVDFTKDTMSLRVLKKIFDLYFDVDAGNGFAYDTLVWVKNISVSEEIHLIKLDYLRFLAENRTESTCKLCGWCQKTKHGAFHDVFRPLAAETYREQFPQIVRELMIERWGEKKLATQKYMGEQLSLDHAFEIMEDNYRRNWIEEACNYGISDEDYWQGGIFYNNMQST